jgi:hypothetical protein
MLGLFITMLTIFIGYVATIWAIYGVLPSISESFYRLPKKYNFIFTLALWGFAFPAIIIGVPTTALMFFAGAGIMFVGAAAQFKQELTKTVHFVGAGAGVVLSQIAIATTYGMWPITAAFVLLSVLILLFRNKIKNTELWWIEILSFISIAIVYKLYYF